ncbi:hypothetical protein, partial [Shigella sonnei]|uniref:hypothetical protein n=1 Tax=Shigella sonnei TaxID=624 RepID=UPI001C0A73F8
LILSVAIRVSICVFLWVRYLLQLGWVYMVFRVWCVFVLLFFFFPARGRIPGFFLSWWVGKVFKGPALNSGYLTMQRVLAFYQGKFQEAVL